MIWNRSKFGMNIAFRMNFNDFVQSINSSFVYERNCREVKDQSSMLRKRSEDEYYNEKGAKIRLKMAKIGSEEDGITFDRCCFFG